MPNTRPQAFNHVLELLDLTFLDETMLQQPSIYGTAVTTVCNLKCPFCIREALGVRENRHMDFDAFAGHVQYLAAARRVSLFGLGEPFLHPRFFDFVDLCRQAGAFVSTSTHGMSLTAEVRERIIETGLDELNISMDAVTPRLFAELRVGAVLETVIEQVTALAALKRERGSALALNVNMAVHGRNVHEVAAMVKLAARMGCQSVSYSSAVIYLPEDEPLAVLETPQLEQQLQQARLFGERLGISTVFWRQKALGAQPDLYHAGSSYGCGQLNSTLIIERSGKVKTCCYLEEYQGDAWVEGPVGAFNNDGMRAQRRALMEGRVRPECQGCVFLRERTPAWVQGMLNEAARVAESHPLLTEEDRTHLRVLIERHQQRKNELYPDHRARPAVEVGAAHAAELATAQPLYQGK